MTSYESLPERIRGGVPAAITQPLTTVLESSLLPQTLLPAISENETIPLIFQVGPR